MKLEITHMAVGDGGGSLPTPNVDTYNKAEINILIDEVKETAKMPITLRSTKSH
ncbi:hypothetical protein [Xenorhabdus taiwanensis]|uniref:hypothetical protein n=1 Tax=Xenorhabdus taiwanensis TaxID=3085177 RepID=UPI0035A68EB5